VPRFILAGLHSAKGLGFSNDKSRVVCVQKIVQWMAFL
jgi:hypothetical protein